MSEGRKRKRSYRVKSHEYKASRDLKSNLKKINWRLAGLLAGCFAVVFTVFRVGIHFEWKAIYPVYYVLTLISLGLFLWFSHGLGGKLPDRELLNMPEEEKDGFLALLERDRKIARAVSLLLIPLLVTFAIDFIQLFWIEPALGLEYRA